MRHRFNAAHLPDTSCEKILVNVEGSHRVRVMADSQFDVVESDERNNRFEEVWNWNVEVPAR
jgi:subtilase family serine protease